MKSVLICAFLALAKHGFAANVCNQEIPDAVLTVSCDGDRMLKYPNYGDMTTYYTCVGGQPLLNRCPAGQNFIYYFQKCGDCDGFISPPDCNFFLERTNSKCSSKVTTTKPIKPTTLPPTTVSPADTPKTPPTGKPTRPTLPPTVPTPPGQSTPSIPMPPMVVTPVPGIPTPPNENITPPSIPGTPPMLTTVQSI